VPDEHEFLIGIYKIFTLSMSFDVF
jgi:hypothetical protein